MTGIEMFCKLIGENQFISIEKLDSEGNPIIVTIKVNHGLSINQIEKEEKKIGIKLPKSFVNFLNIYNGARIFDYDGIDGFLIYGIEDIEKMNKFAKATFEEDWLDYLIIFAKYIGESNYLAFDTRDSQNSIVDCFFEELPEDWLTIEPDFDTFLSKLIEEKGNKYWLINS